MPYELFIALRYLRAKRRQTAVSVITGVATLGITFGVAALLIALALIKGFRTEIQDKILQGTAHLNLLKADGGNIENYRELAAQLSTVPGVLAASATSYEPILLTIGDRSEQAILKGVDMTAPTSANELFNITVEGDAKQLRQPSEQGAEQGAEQGTKQPAAEAGGINPLSIVVGKELARTLGLQINSSVTVVSAASSLTPAGMIPRPRYTNFRVAGFFVSGLYEYDSKWAYVALDALQQLSGKGDSASVIQMRVANIYGVNEIGKRVQASAGGDFVTNNWQELNRPLFAALQLQQQVVIVFFILLIVIATLNIITTLTLMVVEKHREIAILRAQGATATSIARIFCFQGIAIGTMGTLFGLGLGTVLYHFINSYRLIAVPAEIYSISHITLQLRVVDCLSICLISVLISLLATFYPAYTAAKLQPIEALRYE
jgi:lipoprotein-releasing system permease protein